MSPETKEPVVTQTESKKENPVDQEKKPKDQEKKKEQPDPIHFTHLDIIEATKNSGRGLSINKLYDPKFFWEKLGETYYNKFQKKEHFMVNIMWFIDRLQQFKQKTLLDVGTGFGRILPFLLESKVVEHCTGIDISQSILNCSTEFLKPHKESPDFRSQIEMKVGDARKLELDSNSFDVVMVSEILQHLNPDDCELSVREIVRVAKDTIIMVERWAFPEEHAELHLWSHNIVKTLKSLGVEVKQVTTIGNGLQGIIAVKRKV